MLAAASYTVWWPGINGQIKSKYINCTICMQIKRTNNPSTPISEAAANVAIMDVFFTRLDVNWSPSLPDNQRKGDQLHLV